MDPCESGTIILSSEVSHITERKSEPRFHPPHTIFCTPWCVFSTRVSPSAHDPGRCFLAPSQRTGAPSL